MRRLFFLILIVILASACVPKAAEMTPDQPAATQAPTLDAASPSPLPQNSNPEERQSPVPGGITYQEDLRINPPMPRGLKASLSPDGIFLEWQAPEPVSGKHAYSDTPLYYKIYRREGVGRAELIGTSETLSYLDKTARAGVQYAYQVSAVHERELEGTRTDAVQAPVR